MPAHPHCHWRGAQEWKNLDLEMSTTSDEACKMFDASLTQAVNHFNDETVGGISSTIEKMLTADPDFVLGHAFKLGMSGQLIHDDNAFAQEAYHMAALAEKPHVKPWERKHATAVKFLCEGNQAQACSLWEDILVEHPLDMLSLKFLNDACIVNGHSEGLRDNPGRVMSYWKEDMPLYGDMLAMYAFGLEETNFFDQGEKLARKAIDINPHDAWANHCVAHVMDMTGRYQDGINHMSQTENNWNDTLLLCHNYWHWALCCFENGDFESATGILDTYVFPYMKKNKTVFSLTDATSLCFRLEAEGYNVGKRWNDLYDIAKDHEDDHIWSFFDINVMMACVGADKKEDSDHIIQSVRDYIQNGYGDIKKIYNKVTLPVLEAIQAYGDQDYGRAVEIMKPVKYDIQRVGGSHSQRDVFNLFTIHAALKSKEPKHQKYASHLLMERKNLRGETPLVNRLMERLVISH